MLLILLDLTSEDSSVVVLEVAGSNRDREGTNLGIGLENEGSFY